MTVESLYKSMSTESLEQLRSAFVLDRDNAYGEASDETIAFATGRIEVIDRVLAEREKERKR